MFAVCLSVCLSVSCQMHGFSGSIFEASKPQVKETFRVASVLINVIYIL
jgi:hypothetical protein